MKCPQCGAPNESTALSCRHCQAPLPTDQDDLGERHRRAEALVAEAHREMARKPPNLPGAIARAEMALEACPDHCWACLLLGDAYKAMKDWAQAAQHYERVLQCNPDTKAEVRAREQIVALRRYVSPRQPPTLDPERCVKFNGTPLFSF